MTGYELVLLGSLIAYLMQGDANCFIHEEVNGFQVSKPVVCKDIYE